MFVLRRQSDGLFYRNTAGAFFRKDQWITDLQDVKPFRTKQAILHSFYSELYEMPCPECRKTWKSYESCTHPGRVSKAEKLQRFFEKYEVVEIELHVKEQNSSHAL